MSQKLATETTTNKYAASHSESIRYTNIMLKASNIYTYIKIILWFADSILFWHDPRRGGGTFFIAIDFLFHNSIRFRKMIEGRFPVFTSLKTTTRTWGHGHLGLKLNTVLIRLWWRLRPSSCWDIHNNPVQQQLNQKFKKAHSELVYLSWLQ